MLTGGKAGSFLESSQAQGDGAINGRNDGCHSTH